MDSRCRRQFKSRLTAKDTHSGSRFQLDRDRNRTFVFWGMNSVSLLFAFNSGGPGASIGGIVCATGGPTGQAGVRKMKATRPYFFQKNKQTKEEEEEKGRKTNPYDHAYQIIQI